MELWKLSLIFNFIALQSDQRSIWYWFRGVYWNYFVTYCSLDFFFFLDSPWLSGKKKIKQNKTRPFSVEWKDFQIVIHQVYSSSNPFYSVQLLGPPSWFLYPPPNLKTSLSFLTSVGLQKEQQLQEIIIVLHSVSLSDPSTVLLMQCSFGCVYFFHLAVCYRKRLFFVNSLNGLFLGVKSTLRFMYK